MADPAAVLRDAAKRREGGKWQAYVPGHPLARRDGWAPLSRVALFEWLDGDPAPACAAPGHAGGLLAWGSGRGLGAVTVDGERRARVIVWHFDGNERNLARTNLAPVCLACYRRSAEIAPPERGDRGRWVRAEG
jgi:hypothetical protein